MNKRGFSRIVLATDGSDQAKAAVGVAASFGRASSGSVRVVHVWNLELHHQHGVWDEEMRHKAESLIEETVEQLRDVGVEAEGEIVRADQHHVADAVAVAARQFEADLVVVGSRGLSDWQSLVEHSTSHELMGSVKCPLLIVRSTRPVAPHAAQRILLAVAGPYDVVPAVRATLAAAAAAGSTVMVAHVKQSFVGMQGFAYLEPEEEIHSTMARAIQELQDGGLIAQQVVTHPGPIAETLAELAASWNADVIVLGSSRMGDVGSLLLGSVTHDLLRSTERPVLIAEKAAL